MRSTLALIKQHLRDQGLTTLIWAAILGFFSYTVAAMTPSVTQGSMGNMLQELTRDLPPALQRIYGDLQAFRYPADAFLQFKWMLFFPLVTAIYGILAAMGVVAREIERRTADFTLTLPLTRKRLLLSRFCALGMNAGLLYIVSYLLLWIGLRRAGMQASFANYAAFYAGHFSLTLAFAALALWLSLVLDDMGAASRYGLIIAVNLYLLQIVNRVAGGPRWLDKICLFGLVDPESVIARGRFPWVAAGIGLLMTAGMLALGIRKIERKQIPN